MSPAPTRHEASGAIAAGILEEVEVTEAVRATHSSPPCQPERLLAAVNLVLLNCTLGQEEKEGVSYTMCEKSRNPQALKKITKPYDVALCGHVGTQRLVAARVGKE